MSAQPIPPLRAYLCECGKKWVFRPKNNSKGDPAQVCDCGRVIVIRHGIVFSTGKAHSN